MNIYNFSVQAQNGSDVSLADYKGKVLPVVNAATGCRFAPQYDELQDLSYGETQQYVMRRRRNAAFFQLFAVE